MSTRPSNMVLNTGHKPIAFSSPGVHAWDRRTPKSRCLRPFRGGLEPGQSSSPRPRFQGVNAWATERGRRRGAILVVALVCVAVATAAMVCLVQMAIGQRSLVRAEALRLQCCWLAESALDRAAWRLASDPKYPGETWNLPAAALGGSDGAAVTIQVEPVPDRSLHRLVRVRADYPDSADRVRLSKQAVLELKPPGEKK
jgi:hypothetical protein